MNAFHIIVVGVAIVAVGMGRRDPPHPERPDVRRRARRLIVHGYVGGWSGAGMAAAGWAAGVALFPGLRARRHGRRRRQAARRRRRLARPGRRGMGRAVYSGSPAE